MVSTQICGARARGLSAAAERAANAADNGSEGILPGRLPAHHVLHFGGNVEREVGGGAAGAPGDVAEHRLRAATQKGQPRVSPAAGQPCATQARRRRVAAQPAPLRPARRVEAAPPPHAGGEHRCGSHSRPRLALARRAAPPVQRACLVLDHGVHALPQVLHAIVRFGRKKLERKERLGAGAAQRAAGRSRAPRQRRTSPLATFSLILSTICEPAERPSAVRSSAPAAGPQRGARRSRSAARRRPTHLHLRGTAARSRAAPDGGGTRSVFAWVPLATALRDALRPPCCERCMGKRGARRGGRRICFPIRHWADAPPRPRCVRRTGAGEQYPRRRTAARRRPPRGAPAVRAGAPLPIQPPARRSTPRHVSTLVRFRRGPC